MRKKRNLEKLRGHALNHARRLSHEDAEDFAQEAMIKEFFGNGINLDWFLIDFKRKYFGSSTIWRDKQSERRFGISFDSSIEDYNGRKKLGHDVMCGEPPMQFHNLSRKRQFKMLQTLEGRDAEIFGLFIFEGLNIVEIGKIYDITPSRVWQIMKEIKERLSEYDRTGKA